MEKTMEKIRDSTDGHNLNAQTTMKTPIQPETVQLRQP